ncbi:MAG: hypothetical protein ABL964_09955 [Steroidobacteraceae bacterium]
MPSTKQPGADRKQRAINKMVDDGVLNKSELAGALGGSPYTTGMIETAGDRRRMEASVGGNGMSHQTKKIA